MNNIYLSVIIPVYNGEKVIIKTIENVLAFLKKQDFTYEIIVVNDGSSDQTAERVRKEFTNEPAVSLIDRKENRGKGYTVREGMLKAKGELRLFMDDDNSTNISHFDLMKPYFDPVRNRKSNPIRDKSLDGTGISDGSQRDSISNGVEKGYDVVIGSRDSKDAKGARQAVSQVWYKRVMGKMGNLFIQLMAVPGIWDTQCGFKAFTAKAAEKIFSKARIDRWAFDIEVLALARLFKYKIAIIPVYWINSSVSRVKFSTYFEVLWKTIKIRRYIKQLQRSMRL